ncbi:Ubiquinone biosynthesis protein COQ9 mitochondrial [Quillaja saponaria]|uniref:Ubiquinone biosynthesis protein n=1 Tax=Quillaja saponaria TaxID=32244 RepID=A0AAD7VKP5_QUISA|nr:Ubiquinone biosynthesis protein COQ9 mitochondrial [Quillaja saponaria]
MYRTAAKRLFLGSSFRCISNSRLKFRPFQTVISFSGFSTSANSQTFSNQSPSAYPGAENPNFSDSKTPRAEYQDEQARLLQASLPHVIKLGWSEAALIAGARDVSLSPSIIGSFPRKEAALVEFFMDDCLERLIDRIDSDDGLKSLIPSDRIAKLIRIRLEMQVPYISKWPQALSIQAQPLNVPTSFKQRAMLIDEIWHAAGDNTSDIDWYVKRTVLGGIYSTTEIYMLTDSSSDFRDTWAFLDARVKDAFDLQKTVQEAKYLAEAVGAGMGSSLQGFVRSVFRG